MKVRELIEMLLQNGIHAPNSKNIEIEVRHEGDNTLLRVSNDGEPMTEDILVNKLLALGASGKDGERTVRNREFPWLCQIRRYPQYEITTGDLRVKGSGAGYDLEHLDSSWSGTISEVLIEGDHVSELSDIVDSYIHMTQWVMPTN